MTQEGKKGEMKPVSFKMPLQNWLVVQATAAARGVDVSSVLNWIVADYIPRLHRIQEQNAAALALAKARGLSDAVAEYLWGIEKDEGPEKASGNLAELLRLLQALQDGKVGRREGEDRPAPKAA